MMSTVLTVLTLFALTASGIVGGTFFIFSTTIMPVLGTGPAKSSIETMNGINRVIVRTSFIVVFLGNALASLLLIGAAVYDIERPGAGLLLSGAVCYLIGSFLVTIVFNVPRNDALAEVMPGDPAAETAWSRYLLEWTRWNHVRTIACILSTFLLAASLLYN